MSSVPARQLGPLLSAVLAWCAEHPWDGEDLSHSDIIFHQHTADDGTRTVHVLDNAPNIMAAGLQFLEVADPELASFENGLLVLNVQPEKLLYRPLYISCGTEVVVLQHVCSRCHGSRKVPDWTNWNHEYGEPRPKPCPNCLEWPR